MLSRQVRDLDDVTPARMGPLLSDQDHALDHPLDEVIEALQVVAIHVEACGGAEEMLELDHPHHRHRPSPRGSLDGKE